jgi:hypothetical protein
MKNIKSIIGMVASIALVASVVPSVISANAEGEDLIYGTMNIPYADFYKAELSGSANEYEVDAVSSATTAKWCKNGEGELFEGTYNQANDDGTGTILGVTYPVALTSDTLALLGDNNYGFVESDTVPSAYKTVTVDDGVVNFSTVNGDSTSFTADTTINANAVWGDYVVDITSTPDSMGAIYGVVLTTESNESYGLRHLENIWRGELAWSVGFTTQEPHGNTLSYENFQGLMGDTITEITYITTGGYYTLDTSIYVPVKFDGSISADSTSVSSGKTTISTVGIPDDYALSYSVDGLDAQIDGDTITFSNATPASYTLNLVDANGVYMGLSTTFELTTDVTPAQFDGSKLVKANDSSDEDFANYLKNISSVTVNGTTYSASGKGSVAIIGEDGTIDTSITSGREQTAIFSGADSYEVTVSASGYSEDLTFTLTLAEDTPTVTTPANNSGDNDTANSSTPAGSDNSNGANTSSTSNTNTSVSGSDSNNNTNTSGSGTDSSNSNSNNNNNNNNSNNNNSSSKDTSTSPDTSTQGVAVPVGILAVASLGIALNNKRKD